MKTKSKGMSYAKWGYIFLAPFFITFFIFQFWPLATTIYYSFFEYFRSGLKIIGPNFVGLKNYAAMIKEVPKYFSNTMIMWLMGFIPQIIVSLVLAAWFTDLRLKLRFQGFFKTVIYMPNLIMASAFAMLFFTLFSNAETGPINSILLKLGIVAEPVRWLSNVWTARGLVGLMNFLMWFGNTTIILMAAIMGVDPGLYEAAQLDGASSTTMFWRITIPLIRPLLVYTLITSLIGGLQMFDVPQTGAAVQALEGLARDEQHDDRGDDSRDDDGPEVFEDHAVGVHQPHPVGHEKERHGPQQEPRRGAHRLGPHPAQAQRSKEQDHADDEQSHTGKGAGLEALAQEEPAAQRGAQDAEAAPHGVGHGQVHILDGQREAVKGQTDQGQSGNTDQALFEAIRTGQHEVGGHVQSRGCGHQASGKDEMQRFRIHGELLLAGGAAGIGGRILVLDGAVMDQQGAAQGAEQAGQALQGKGLVQDVDAGECDESQPQGLPEGKGHAYGQARSGFGE